MRFSWLCLGVLCLTQNCLTSLFGSSSDENELLLLTVATNKTDGFQRYLRSARIFDLNGKALGLGESWKGGDMNYPGGGFKVNLLKKELEEHKDKENLVIMFTDSYDVIITAGKEQILERFKEFDSRIVFGAEPFCWPRMDFESKYPEVKEGKRFLNSGGFIGYARDLYEMVNHKEIDDKDDDQLYYTEIFLDENLRNKWQIKLDHKSKLFQNLHGTVADVELRFKGNEPYLQNVAYETQPIVIHGNGPSVKILNHLGNYLPSAWNKEDHCTSCWEDTIQFSELPEVPQVVMGIFIEYPTPFMVEFFQLISKQEYPKSKIDLLIHVADKFHTKDVENFVSEHQNENSVEQYNSVTVIGPEDGASEGQARNLGIMKCVEVKCDYYFSVDSDAHLDNLNTLKLLIEQNRGVIAPLLVRPFKAWSNFWGALNPEGFYARSTDYMEIAQNTRRGLWNVPFVSTSYLIQGRLIHNKETRPSFDSKNLDPDMAFCYNLRENAIFIYVSNRVIFGHLINSDDFKTEHKHNELWEIINNQYDWELRYLHPNYSQSFEEEAVIAQPCPDVFWFPIVTERFADELVEEMENFGKWSDGTNNDQRIEGGYEAVPTRDIHMKQIGMDEQWLEFLRLYVKPLVEKEFTGYQSDPPRSTMNFVVRYRQDEQPLLRPHHDASTYTINIALNHAGKDFTGGGCNFLRYDCSIPDTKKGWMLMHPGRLTHYHEGLETLSGTRYIMISFVDP